MTAPDPAVAAAIERLRREQAAQMLRNKQRVPPPPQPEPEPEEPPPAEREPGGDGPVFVKPWPKDCPVTPLGHHEGVFYFLDAAGQFVGLPREKLVRTHLLGLFLDHIDWLYQTWPRLKKLSEDGDFQITGWRPEQVAEAAIDACSAKGVIDPADLVRGPGAWQGESGELIMHCGDVVLVGAKPADAPAPWTAQKPGVIGRHIYPRAPRLPRPHGEAVPAAASPASELLTLFQTWSFARGDLDALLLLGWVGAAMLGGALKWRPVIWISGGAGTGKSTMWGLVQLLVRELRAYSDASAAGLWQTLQMSTRAIAIDELENEADPRKAQNVIKLARQAASGGKINRGGQDHRPVEFIARSCFAFLSINIPALLPQDRSRMAILELRKLKRMAAPRFDADALALAGAKLRRRLFDAWPRLEGLIETYRAALEEQGHSARGCDVFGTLLGVADALMHDLDVGDRAPPGEPGGFDVGALAARLNAATLAETSDSISDERAMIGHLLSQVVDPWRNGSRAALYEYVRTVVEQPEDGELQLEQQDRVKLEANAGRALSLHGLLVVNGEGRTRLARTHLAIAYQHPALLGIFAPTRWAGAAGAVGPWVQAAKRLPGAAVSANAIWFAGGSSRAVLVPLDAIMERGMDLDTTVSTSLPAPVPPSDGHGSSREAGS